MSTLPEDLQSPKKTLSDFHSLTCRILDYLPNVLNDSEIKGAYQILASKIAGTTKYIRPINQTLFIWESSIFQMRYDEMISILNKKKTGCSNFRDDDLFLVDQVLYTIQQSIGAGLDLLVNPNSARKHVGNRFEELMRAVFSYLEVANKRVVLQIPYETDEGKKTYKCENDLIISPYQSVRSTAKFLDDQEIVISVKTTSKDRMGKMFIDKMLLERFVGHPQRIIGIFLNDVQRKESNNISYTLVSGLFMVYSNFLTKLDGIYYLDPPPIADRRPYSDHIRRFSYLILYEIDSLLTAK